MTLGNSSRTVNRTASLPASFRNFTISGKKVTDYNVTAFDPTRHVKAGGWHGGR